MSDEYLVSDPAMARLLTHHDGAGYLGPFLEQDRSIQEAADRMSKPIGRVHYWVRRFHDAGLLEVTAEVARAGRPIKRYRAIAVRFRVPAEMLPVDHFEKVMGRLNDELTQALASAADMPSHDLTLSPSIDGDITMDRVNDARKARKMMALQTSLGGVHLTREQAENLQKELSEIRDRFLELSDRDAPGARPFLVHLAMAPRQE